MYKKGDYEVEAEGHHSTVKLRVSFDEEKLAKIEVLEENETQVFVDDLKDRFIPEVVANQSLNVDAISGATKLTKAVTSSVEEAITEAGGDPKTFTEAAHVTETKIPDADVTADVVVIGSGASGFMSAITAAKAGSKVVVLEKAGNLAAVNGVKVSGPFAVNTPVLRERGTTLTVNEVFQHVMNYTHWEPNSALIRNYLEHSSEAVENLLEIGYQFKEANFRFKTPFVDEKGGFHLILTDVDKRVRLWTEAYEKYGVDAFFNTAAKEVLKENGKIAGVAGQRKDGSKVTVHAKSVIIASGGYLGNKELLLKYLGTTHVNVAARGKSLCTGDGLAIAQKAGTILDKTFGYCGCEYGGTNPKASRPATQDKYDQNLAFKFGIYGNLLVDNQGKRFMNEGLLCDYPMSYGEEPTLRHSPYYAIVDQEYVDKMRDEGLYEYLTKRGANHDNWFIGSYYKQRGALRSLDSDLEEGIHEGWIVKADTLEELAKKTGFDHLTGTVASYNSYCEKGEDEQFGANPWYLSSVKQGPFYAIECEVSAWSTFGGVKTDDECRALAEDDQVIPGMYVVGTDNGSMMYSPYYDIPGFCYGSCIGSGVIAGHGASAYAKA